MDAGFRKYWPLPSGLDFVRGDFITVGMAVEAEFKRFIGGEQLSKESRRISCIAEVFAWPDVLDNVGLHYFVLPTRSEWTAIWTSNFLCSGHDSLSYCLTKNHTFETLHFVSSENIGPFQPGTVLSYRSKSGERHVAAIQEDRRWIFHQSGAPLPFEDTARYEERKISDRWNTSALLTLLDQIGIRPWSEDYYDFARPVIHLERKAAPSSVLRMTRGEFARRYEHEPG